MNPLRRPPSIPAAAIACAVLLGSAGCGRLARQPAPEREGDLAAVLQREFPMCADMLKASTNGICQNGLDLSGLTANGLGVEGLNSASFGTWFERDPAGSNVLMRYLVKCAAPATDLVTWTSPSGVAYGWVGGLGLATQWAAGHPMSKAEQQLLSACLGAHVNKYRVTVPLSVLGRVATGEPVALDPGELATFPVKEGCFFGNLFAGEPVMVGLDHDEEEYDARVSSSRACALQSQEPGTTSEACAPMIHVGSCEDACVHGVGGEFYESCTWGGKQYLPVTTRVRESDIYKCGDGVCQFTESCGTGDTAGSCYADCGACAGGSTDPVAPTDPVSTDPADSSEPTDPAAPSEPTDPAAPSEPTDPAAPTDPTDPAAPSEPTDPAAPTDPAVPSDP